MNGSDRNAGQELLTAFDDLLAPTDRDALWAGLQRQLAQFEISGCIYGTEPFPQPGKFSGLIMNSISDHWLNEKLSRGLFSHDEYVTLAATTTAPILWDDPSTLANLTAEAYQSLSVDYDHGVLTGVTIPMPFGRGYGASGIGLHAGGMTFTRFRQLWQEKGPTMTAIVHGFDTRLRENCRQPIFTLSPAERDCLQYLASGLRPQRVAERLGLSDKQAFRLIAGARRRLSATSTAQALAIALIYKLIAP